MKAIDKVIGIAENEIGYLEKKSNTYLDDKTKNAGSANYTKYWRDIKPEYQGQPWCACFVTWCFLQAFGMEKTIQLLRHYPYVYCPAMAGYFTLNANPKIGDIVVFYRGGEFVHTGIVVYVNGDYFETIEGNTSGGSSIIANGGGVCRKKYYNLQLPGTKFITVDWKIVDETEEISVSQYEELKEMIKERDKTIEEQGKQIEKLLNVVENTMIYNYNDENIPEWARAALTAAIDCGAVQGDENGELHLNYKDLRNIVREYRRGMYAA